jgi:hypothetical protein
MRFHDHVALHGEQNRPPAHPKRGHGERAMSPPVVAKRTGFQMSEIAKLLKDIHSLREAIQIDWEEVYSNPHREEGRREIRKHLELCQAELKTLIERLEAFDGDISS